MIRRETMNAGIDKKLAINLDSVPYFARRHRILIPFIIVGAFIYVVFGGDIDGFLRRDVNYYVPSEKKKNPFYMTKLLLNMLYYRYRYEFKFKEYFLFNFEHISRKERLEFIAGHERLRIYGQIHDVKNIDLFAEKYDCYLRFKDYYKRDIVFVGDSQDLVAFSMFVNAHDKFIFKPNHDSGGNGIMIVDKNNSDFNMMTLFKSILATGCGVVEEFVQQDDAMGAFHPESVNTIRFTTYYNKEQDKFVKMYAMLRVGQGGAGVDNASAGGIVAAIDLDTGVIKSDGRCEDNRVYIEHPDSHIAFMGYQIPKWDELNAMLNELVRVIPEHKLVGWDLALDKEKGWLLIEANSCPGMIAAQICHGGGFRDIFRRTVLNDIEKGHLYANARL